MSYKICFVCTGNACRSPFAECVTKKLLTDAGLNGIEVFSLGRLDWGERILVMLLWWMWRRNWAMN